MAENRNKIMTKLERIEQQLKRKTAQVKKYGVLIKKLEAEAGLEKLKHEKIEIELDAEKIKHENVILELEKLIFELKKK